MKKVLVIIDNIIQYSQIKEIAKKASNIADFSFKHSNVKSAIWEHEDFNNKSESIIDVKTQIQEIVSSYDLVISVHCFQIFPEELIKKLRCINIHPGYNPINRGWYPQVFSIIHNLPIGATIHEMDEKLDNGPIIARELVETFSWDTSLSIYNRVLEKEIYLFDKYLDLIIDGSYSLIKPEGKGNFYSKKDFKRLCNLDMNRVGTFNEFYNHLRALTHEGFKNAFFIDPETNKKIFIKLDISVE